MEGEARLRAGLRNAPQQLCGFLGTAAILAGHFQQCAAQRRDQPHEDAQTGWLAGFGQQLVQLGFAVDHEVGDAMLLERGLGLARQAHRRHEMADGFGQNIFHRLDFAQRGGIEMADARGPQLLERDGMRVGLRRIQNVTVKAVQELLGDAREFFRMHQIQRFGWLQAFDCFQRRSKARQIVETGVRVHQRVLGLWAANRNKKRRQGCCRLCDCLTKR